MPENNRTPVKEKAKQLIKLLRQENPDYNYLREVFRQIRKELDVQVNTGAKKNYLRFQQKKKLLNITRRFGKLGICSTSL